MRKAVVVLEGHPIVDLSSDAGTKAVVVLSTDSMRSERQMVIIFTVSNGVLMVISKSTMVRL